ncbi:hypothetical protein RND81_06G243100 [Saponaria officinalis]|uniref:TF-B3 domain-containing protein n=1 Tax=Saponaria officinalis TaxID=3572 RepID=A0AAW1KEU5_SAPOF
MDPCENQQHRQQQQQQQQQQLRLKQREWLMDPEEVPVEERIGHKNNGSEIEVDHDKGGGYGVVVVEREHMFDKVVTPSDVGKLNRLVIPKQHAEKYFPLDSSNNNNNNNNNSNNNSGGSNSNSNSNSNNNESNNNNKAGLLLNFEDRTGKSWRFRYSYWNSSQSYVMTKGWSRFVKEKQLSAGDIVSFQRAVGDDLLSKNTFFIDWRRRPPDHHHQYHHHHHHHLGTAFSVHHSIPGWMRSNSSSIPSPITSPTLFLRSHPHESHPHHHHNNNNNNNNNNSIWDHSGYNSNSNSNNNNNNNVTHLSMVPYAYGGSGTTSVVNPTTGSSLILLRSPVPNPSAINHPHLVPNYPPYHHHLNASSSNSSNFNSFYQGNTNTTTSTRSLFEPNKVYDSVPVVHGKAPAPPPHGGGGAAKRSLRLFGVNMEYDQHNHHQLNGSMDPSTSN